MSSMIITYVNITFVRAKYPSVMPDNIMYFFPFKQFMEYINSEIRKIVNVSLIISGRS